MAQMLLKHVHQGFDRKVEGTPRGMTIMMVWAKVRPEKQVEFLQAMRSLKDDCEKEEGLTKVTLYQESDCQMAFSLIYEWEKVQDLERYFKAEKFKVLRAALKVLAKKSEIRYGQISKNFPDLSDGTYGRCSELKADLD